MGGPLQSLSSAPGTPPGTYSLRVSTGSGPALQSLGPGAHSRQGPSSHVGVRTGGTELAFFLAG